MGWLDRLFGTEDPAPDPLPEGGESAAAPTMRTGSAEYHRDRFARAVEQCRIHVANGEKDPARLAELERQEAYWSALVAAQAQLQEG